MKKFLKKIIPPVIIDAFKKPSVYGFFGNYQTWNDARSQSRGYDAENILEKVVESSMKVKNGEVAFERDSVTFIEKQYLWPVLSYLLYIASLNKNKLNILDFGGSLGTIYFQHLDFLKHLDLKWNIVEQKNFVEAGKKHFEDNILHFYDDSKLSETLSQKPDVVLFGSSLQYIEKPYQILQMMIGAGVKRFIIDRTPFSDDDRITVQKVSEKIYEASYPAWIFNFSKMKNFFSHCGYSIKAEIKEGSMPLSGENDSVSLYGLFIEKNV